MAVIRTQRIAAGVLALPPAGGASTRLEGGYVYTCPADHLVIVRHIDFGAEFITIQPEPAIGYGACSLEANGQLVIFAKGDWTGQEVSGLRPYWAAQASWTGTCVMNPGERLYVSSDRNEIHYQISGAILPIL